MYPIRLLLAWSLVMVAATAALVVGCGANSLVSPCDNPIVGGNCETNADCANDPRGPMRCHQVGLCIRLDHTGHDDECCEIDPCDVDAGTDAGDAGAATDAAAEAGPICPGDCLPLPPVEWSSPGLLWPGSAGAPPVCPGMAPVAGFNAHADLNVPSGGTCTACSCSASMGTCAPPLHFSVSDVSCLDNGPAVAISAPPPGWDGTCTNANPVGPVVAATVCAVPPCFPSVTTGPLEVTELGCTPSVATLADAPMPSWNTDVRFCIGSTFQIGSCSDLAQVCAPSAAAAPGFLACVFQAGDQTCPETYPDKHLVYSGLDDQRGCDACACAASADSFCTATLDIFKDSACSAPLPFSNQITSLKPQCFDLAPTGPTLGSKDVDKLTYQSGTCAPTGGEPMGAVIPSAPSTFCCLPPP